MTEEAMAPWFRQAEQAAAHRALAGAAQRQQREAQDRCERIGVAAGNILRNVKGCWNLGSCGMGCPTNAKQSMLVTTIPAALDRGATLLVQTRAQTLELADGRVQAVQCVPVAINGTVQQVPARASRRAISCRRRGHQLAGLLMRSKLPDPHGRLGRRTFLHPVVLSTAVFDERIDGWQGAPQTLYTDHFQDTVPIDGPIGYKLEAPPLHPVIASLTMAGFGDRFMEAMKAFVPHAGAAGAAARWLPRRVAGWRSQAAPTARRCSTTGSRPSCWRADAARC
jgi:hypothetical protein